MPSITRYYSSTAAKTTLSSAVDSGSTSLQLAAASGLPSQYPFTLILEKDTANEEIIDVTGLVGSAYTVTRGVDGSTAKSHSVGATVEHGVSGRDYSDSRSHEAATSAHGVTGDIVGTGGAQTLTSKTYSGGTLSGSFTSTATITGGTITGAAITGLSAPSANSDAATKVYVDAVAGSATSAANSATAAATSATSAANSATAAATSATSAANSATAAASSATAAATSASSALTSQTSAATSATSAAVAELAADVAEPATAST
jgi:hypothetical protein